MAHADSPDGSSSQWRGFVVGGTMLVAIHVGLLLVSPRFAYGELPVLERPTVLVVALMMAAGAIYLASIWWVGLPQRPTRQWWLWMIVVGLAMRALMFPSTPILETDYYRYLWDGAVVSQADNPYAHPPRAIRDADAPPSLVDLADRSERVIERVNHPELTTIYPPTAQATFAIGHVLLPWRIEGLRIVWLLLDAATLLLLLGLLRRLALPLSFVLIYWWNPLLVKEIYNTAHMDIVLLPLMVGALWLAANSRLAASGAILAAAVGAKIWPVILMPAMLWRKHQPWKHVLTAGGASAVLSVLIVSPMLLTHFDEQAGVRAYAGTWQMNAALYQVIDAAADWIAPDHAGQASRVLVAAILLAWIAWLCRRPATDGRAVCERAMWITAGLFLLSPTAYPWYWLWLLPMLVVRPSPGLMILTALLPMYYLRFPLHELGRDEWFRYGVVWAQFAPAFILLIYEAGRNVPFAPTTHQGRRLIA